MISSYKYDENTYAKKIFDSNKFQTKHIPTELRLLVIYYRDVLGLKPKDRKIKLYKFCEDNIPDFNKAVYYKIINRALQRGSNKKQKLVTIDKVDIYKDEVDYINSLDIKYDYKKIMFAFLVQMRLNKIMYEKRNNKEYKATNYFKGGKQKYKNILSMANVSSKIDINDDFVNDLSQGNSPLITVLCKGLIILNFLNNCKQIGDIAFAVKNYEDVGWYLDYYNHIDKIKLCAYCEQPFKQHYNNECYCRKHKEYQPIETKTLACVDCGHPFTVDARNMTKKRCDECQHKIDNEKTRLRMKKYRDK
jgi:hypothetical protein